MTRSSAIDWEAVEVQYRAGIRSLKDIGAEFGCSDAAIIKRARAHEWPRDLEAKIKARAKAKVSAAAVSGEVSARTKVKETEVVEANAELHYQVILRHRRDVQAATKHTTGMLEELGSASEKKLPLAKRAPILKQLTEALRIQQTLERQAFGISGDPDDQPEHIANAAAAAAAGATAALSNGRTFTDTERAVRLVRLLQAGQIPAAPAAEAPPA
jgi:hypothetical protein